MITTFRSNQDSAISTRVPKLALGNIVANAKAITQITTDELLHAISRHLIGDYGEISAREQEANGWALLHGDVVLSIYTSKSGRKFSVITDAKREFTNIRPL